MKVALVHDYLSEFGGAERVLLALHEIWPQAPIYTAFCKKGSVAARAFKRAKIVESYLAPVLKFKNLFSPLRFLTPLIWKSFNFKNYDLVVASSSWYMTRGFRVGPKTRVICYCHTPPRYLYGYKTAVEWQRYGLVRLYALVINHFLRQDDYRSAQEVDEFIANSKNVAKRIWKFYRREATVIYPPVEIDTAVASQGNTSEVARRRPRLLRGGGIGERCSSYFLCVSRLSRPKNIDLAIKACNKLGCRLWVVGGGKERHYLESIAGSTIRFLGQVDDEELAKIYAGCRAFLALAEDEDFGITPVEAMAAGRPVIAFRGGGYLETVIEGKTGLFFDELKVDSLVTMIERFNDSNYWSSQKCVQNCLKRGKKFSKERFKREVRKFVEGRMETRKINN